MDFKNLQKELFERKLRMGEYFKRTFKVLKVFMKENVLWTMFFMAVNIGVLILGVIDSKLMSKISLLEYFGIFLSRQAVIPIFASAFNVAVITKVANKIETNKENYKFKNIFPKFLKYIAIYITFTLVAGFMTEIILRVEFNHDIIKMILSTMLLIVVFSSFIIMLNILYFSQTYYTKNMKIIDALKYNLKLSQGNRLRIIIPFIIFSFIEFRITLPFINGFFVSYNVPMFVVLIMAIIFGIILSYIKSFFTAMSVVIFFNVEYDYLRKQNENLK